MAEIKVLNIGTQILVVIDNTNGTFYNKEDVRWSAIGQKMILEEKSILDGVPTWTTVQTLEPSYFISPGGEYSVVDLLLILNNMLLVSGSKPERVITASRSITNDDANYIIITDVTAGDVTLTMPSDAQAGLFWQFKDNGNAAPNKTVINGGGKNVEGVATAPDMTVAYEARLLYLSETQEQYLIL